MKKITTCALLLVIALALCACGANGTQKISFQGITMEIPSSWKAEKNTLADDYAKYEQFNKIGHDYQLLLQDTYGLLPTYDGDLERAGAFFKEVTEDDASYSDVSDPVAGTFAGKYDMHTINCTYHALNPMEEDGESDYPCKLIRIYKGDRDVKMEFCAKEGDFEAFDKAVENAVCE